MYIVFWELPDGQRGWEFRSSIVDAMKLKDDWTASNLTVGIVEAVRYPSITETAKGLSMEQAREKVFAAHSQS